MNPLKEIEDRIFALLANKKVNAKTEFFLCSLLDNIKQWGQLTDKQEKALDKIEADHTEEAITIRAEWEANWNEERRKTAIICARYYTRNGTYFADLASNVLDNPEFIPTEKQFKAMCENKYAKRVLENAYGEPKYSVGSFVTLRDSAPRHFYHQMGSSVWNLPSLVIEAGVSIITTAAKGGKKYKILPVGTSNPLVIEERYIKKIKKVK